MRFEKSDAVADEGVAAVNMLFSRELRRIFREVSKRDVGVDKKVAWASSANLTWRGVMNTFEVLGASTERATLRRCLEHFEDLWDRAIPLSTALRQRA